MAKQVQKSKKQVETKASKKSKKQVQKVRIRIKSAYNNTIVTVTDYEGNVISSSSGGVVGFKGSKKSTAFAATRVAEDAVEKAMKQGAKEAIVVVKGMGMGRQAAVKGVRAAGLKITSLSDYTPVPHGGTVPRKRPKK